MDLGGLLLRDYCPYKKIMLRYEGKTPCEDGGWDGSHAATDQGKSKMEARHQKLWERQGRMLPRISEDT